MEKNYIEYGLLPESDEIENHDSELIKKINFVQDTFEGNIFEIMNKLKNSNIDFANKIFENLLKKCPMSLAVTTELHNRAKHLSLKECLEMEFQLSQHIVYREDFNNGVKAVLVTKTHNPLWNPQSIHDINLDELNNLFQIHTKKLNL